MRGKIAVGVLAAAALVYAHPLLTGAAVPDERPLLPSAHVRVPQAWNEVEAYLDAAPGQGKIVVFPQLDYYQAPTTWGYYGASFLHHFLERPVVEPLPGGYYSDPVVAQHVASLEQQILDGGRNARVAMQALGAKYLLLRRDLQASFPGRSLVPPKRWPSARTHTRPSPRSVIRGTRLVRDRTPRSGEVYASVPLLGAGAEPAALYRAIQVGPKSRLSARALRPRSAASPRVTSGSSRRRGDGAEPPRHSRGQASRSPSGVAASAPHYAFQESRRRFEPSWARGASS